MFGKNGLGEHSRAKLELFRTYLDIYLRIISRDKLTDTIHLFDLFCGEGQYAEDDGSPLVLYKAIMDFSQVHQNCRKKGLRLHLLFNDADKVKYQKVKTLLENRPALPDCNIDFFNEDFQSLLPRILPLLQSAKREKFLIFLDPCGYKDIYSDNIKALLAGNKSEIIWFIPISFLYRFANHAADSDDPSFYPLQRILSDFFPNGLPPCANQLDFIKVLLARFKKALSGYYIDTFTIERDSNSLFCLFFFTSHIRGFEKMLEAKWAIDEREGRGFKLDSRIGNLFPSSHIMNYSSMVMKYLSSRCSVTNKEMYTFSLNSGFLPKHTNQVLKELDTQGVLVVRSKKKIKKWCYYLDYKYHLITIELKK